MMLGKRPLESFWFFTWCISGPIITLVNLLTKNIYCLIRNVIFSNKKKYRSFSFHQLYDFKYQRKVIMNIQHMQMHWVGLWFVHRSSLFRVL
jgi:hypothetical protein